MILAVPLVKVVAVGHYPSIVCTTLVTKRMATAARSCLANHVVAAAVLLYSVAAVRAGLCIAFDPRQALLRVVGAAAVWLQLIVLAAAHAVVPRHAVIEAVLPAAFMAGDDGVVSAVGALLAILALGGRAPSEVCLG